MPTTGYLRDQASGKDWLYSSVVSAPAALPQSISHESLVGPSFDQGETFECVCYSVAGLKRYQEWKDAGKWLDFDKDEFYRLCKANDGASGQNGTYPRVALDLLRTNGILGSDGIRYKVSAYARQSTLAEVKQALYTSGPVVLGLQIDVAALSALEGSSVFAPATPPPAEGHCVLAVGYDDARQALRIRNSWGSTWADDGHFWLSYSYLTTLDPSFDGWSAVDFVGGAN